MRAIGGRRSGVRRIIKRRSVVMNDFICHDDDSLILRPENEDRVVDVRKRCFRHSEGHIKRTSSP